MTGALRPDFDAALARAVLATHFGISAEVEDLPGERDRNFAVRTPEGRRFVLKFAAEDELESALSFQAALVAHIAQVAPEVPVPRFCDRVDGTGPLRVEGRDGRRHFVRVATWLPGALLAHTRPRTAALHAELGATLGRLDRALATFHHPAARRAGFEWDLTNGLAVIAENLAHVHEPAERALLERTRRAIEAALATHSPELRRSVAHNDANDHNVLVALDLAGGAAITGLIDLGDACETWTAAEPAIAAAYAALDKELPLATIAQVVAGYHREHPLNEAELAVVFPLVQLRLAVSVALAARNAQRFPDDAYLQVTARPAWRTLAQLAEVPPALALAELRGAAGLDPAPHSTRALTWIGGHRPVPVMAGDLAAAPRVDLSVASTLTSGEGGDLDVPSWGERVEALIAAAPEHVAVGYYGEARLVYDTPQFDAPSDTQPERRTIHLGVDVFAPAGTAVVAPYAATVVSVADNDLPLDYGPTVILRHEPAPDVVFDTLYGHLDREVLTRLAPGAPLAAGALVGRLGPPAHNGGWTPHLHLQLLDPTLAAVGDAPGVAAPNLADTWLALCPDPAPLLGLASARAPRPRTAALLAARRARLGPSLSLSYRRPLTIVKGRGALLFDAEGRRYLDCVNNVAHVGHCHPHVVESGARQMAVLNTNTRYLHPTILEYTERLLAKLPAPLEVLYLVCSGSEANELALRLARTATGARDVLVQEAGYHGNTQGLVELSHYKFAGKGGFTPPPHVHVIPLPDPDGGRHRGAASGPAYVREVERLLGDLAAQGRRPAALLAEAIIGCGGQIVPPAGYLRGAFEAVRRAGGVAIADEVQVGFGRVGSHFWAFDEAGAVPDIVTMGKPIGNGHPLGAVATTRAIADAFHNGMEYFNTFGGNPVSCAIGAAVLDVLEREDLPRNALARGQQLLQGAAELRAVSPLVGAVRGRGLYQGIALERGGAPATAEAHYVRERLRERAFLVSTDGPHDNVLKLKPPLVISEGQIAGLLAALADVLAEAPLRG